MNKKYYILVLTFLCLLSGQASYAYGDEGWDTTDDYSIIDELIDWYTDAGFDVEVYETLDDVEEFLDEHPEYELDIEWEYIHEDEWELWQSGHSDFEESLAYRTETDYMVVPVGFRIITPFDNFGSDGYDDFSFDDNLQSPDPYDYDSQHDDSNDFDYCYYHPDECYGGDSSGNIQIPDWQQTKVTSMNFDNLRNNYEDGEVILNRETALNNLANKNTNTCAIRLSNALNKSGYPIPRAGDLPNNVRGQSGAPGDSGNYVLDARSMKNYLSLIEKPTETYTIKTNEGIDIMIKDIHSRYDDMKGIIVYVADDIAAYGATGHADLIYEDLKWDLSFSSGKDVEPYLKDDVLPKTTFTAYLWVLDHD